MFCEGDPNDFVLVIVEGGVELAVTTGRRRVTVVDPGALHSFKG